MYQFKQEQQSDWWEVEALYDLCFAPGREALSSYRLRDQVAPVVDLSMVARDPDGILGGAIRYWPIIVGCHNALLLGPVAVHPTRQGEGLGGALIRDSLVLAARQGWRRALLVGDAPYYRRYGFEKLNDVVMPPPTNPDRVLGLSIIPDAWLGVCGPVQSARDR